MSQNNNNSFDLFYTGSDSWSLCWLDDERKKKYALMNQVLWVPYYEINWWWTPYYFVFDPVFLFVLFSFTNCFLIHLQKNFPSDIFRTVIVGAPKSTKEFQVIGYVGISPFSFLFFFSIPKLRFLAVLAFPWHLALDSIKHFLSFLDERSKETKKKIIESEKVKKKTKMNYVTY
jgi:hypothetical protein